MRPRDVVIRWLEGCFSHFVADTVNEKCKVFSTGRFAGFLIRLWAWRSLGRDADLGRAVTGPLEAGSLEVRLRTAQTPCSLGIYVHVRGNLKLYYWKHTKGKRTNGLAALRCIGKF
jgi:hypothetical protein